MGGPCSLAKPASRGTAGSSRPVDRFLTPQDERESRQSRASSRRHGVRGRRSHGQMPSRSTADILATFRTDTCDRIEKLSDVERVIEILRAGVKGLFTKPFDTTAQTEQQNDLNIESGR